MAIPPLQREFQATGDDPDRVLRALRAWLPEYSWSQLRQLLETRRVTIDGALCLFEERRLQPGQRVTVHPHPLPPPPDERQVQIAYRDLDVVVVEKPPRMITLRHRAEAGWPADKKRKQPSLAEAVLRLLGGDEGLVPLFAVHRIDRDTSGLLVFARTQAAAERLIEQFAAHSVDRLYRALIPGTLADQTVRTRLVRDRGDGLRGSARGAGGRDAVTHVRTLRLWREPASGATYSEVECRLETGRTHQIRIHLAELGRPLCGDVVYRGSWGEPSAPDASRAPRLALHAAELGFTHPSSGQRLHYVSPWPRDIQRLLERWTPLSADGVDCVAAPPLPPSSSTSDRS